MQYSKFFVALVFSSLFLYVLHRPMTISGERIPPLGKLLNPFHGFWANAEEPDQFNSSSFNFQELESSVNVVFDERLVPHIYAQNLSDALFVQGFITAKYRLWQMDISTRASAGRLSEVMGSKTIEHDRKQRNKGILWSAEKAVQGWQKEKDAFKNLESYTAGVNQYIASLSEKEYPLMFKLLDYKPEKWTPLKTALFIKSMAEVLASRSDDVAASNMLDYFGQQAFDFIYPEHNDHPSPVISESNLPTEQIPDLGYSPSPAKGLFPNFAEDRQDGIGSNNWAVSGRKTKNGHPILCNDPHLQLTLPSIWFEVHLHTPELNSYGVSLPGVPGIIIGFNDHIAWGMTNVGHDVLDWYTLEWQDASKQSYKLDGKYLPVTKREERIQVRGAVDLIDSISYTSWGPVFESKKGDLAMRWLPHNEPSQYELDVFLSLLQAKDHNDYVSALEGFESPAQNIVFASSKGDIALKVQGKFPLKRKGQGRFVQDGTDSRSAWSGYIDKKQNPQALNPERGFVSSANQRSTDKNYPYYYNGSFEDYRGRYLNQRLTSMEDITVDDMKALQVDNLSLKASDALPLMIQQLEGLKLSDSEKGWIDRLAQWDYRYDADSQEAVFFDAWFRKFYLMTWDEVRIMKDSMKVLYPESWRTIALLRDASNHQYFDRMDTDQTEYAKDILKNTFSDVVIELQKSDSADEILWYQKNKTSIKHVGKIPAFGSEILKVGGTGSALNANSWGSGPSWRMIVEMKDSPEGLGVFPGGQSENPASAFYDNMVNDWATGKYHTLVRASDPKNIDALFSIQFN